jgi:hypothetical protein
MLGVEYRTRFLDTLHENHFFIAKRCHGLLFFHLIHFFVL